MIDLKKSIAVFRICEHCNKDYELELSYSGDRTMAVNNFQTCPNCKERDDAWVKIKVRDDECEHPFARLHWVDNVVFCNKCKKTLHK